MMFLLQLLQLAFVASAAGCLGSQRHLEEAVIVSSSRSCRDIRHGSNDADRGRVYLVDIDKGLRKQTNTCQTVTVTEAIDAMEAM